ncbi:hypothetical protein BN975_04578 [Mycolicibacterium farcinogenes]|uniref:Uncharacterized protein n=2 Tax=Mycobacteriaceae TaxID=1762 RepID=A0A378SY57_9MYCO|nr:hypothetical protein BN975_04578 [Mycolicibacterium farcinogenes]STZ53459.1 Uncharacterised protein [Mycolicibacterium senegalense]
MNPDSVCKHVGLWLQQHGVCDSSIWNERAYCELIRNDESCATRIIDQVEHFPLSSEQSGVTCSGDDCRTPQPLRMFASGRPGTGSVAQGGFVGLTLPLNLLDLLMGTVEIVFNSVSLRAEVQGEIGQMPRIESFYLPKGRKNIRSGHLLRIHSSFDGMRQCEVAFGIKLAGDCQLA